MQGIKMSKELYLASGKVDWYINSFNTIDELIDDFSSYKTINYQLGVAIINIILNNITPERFSLFSKIISIGYREDESPSSDCYPNIIYIETDKGNFRLKWDRYWTPDGTKIKLKDTIDTGDNELMIHAVANWIKQLMN